MSFCENRFMVSAEMSPEIMGIINLTDDSFSVSSRYRSLESLWHTVETWLEAGVSYLDLGAESSRPGSLGVSTEDQWSRLMPVLEYLCQKNLTGAAISIDARYHEIWQRSLEYPQVQMINSIGGYPKTLEQKQSLTKLKKKQPNLKFMAMHLHGAGPHNMQDHPLEEEEVEEAVEQFFGEALKVLADLGFSSPDIYLDPGIGFGKTVEANLKLIERAFGWSSRYTLGYGISRKSFIGALSGEEDPEKRDCASKVLEVLLIRSGVKLIRTHNPLPVLKYLNKNRL